MKYEMHKLGARKLPFIFHYDEMNADIQDYTHWHENLEILWFREGEGCAVCDYRRTDVKKDDIFVINSEKLHMIESDSLVRYYCFIVDVDFCLENGIDIREMTFEARIDDEKVSDAYSRLVDAFASEDELREARIKSCALSLLLSIAERHTLHEDESEQSDPHLQNVKQAIKYIKENFQKSITLDSISEAAGLSRAYFSREFRRITGYTVTNYVNYIRCQNAAKLLKSGRYRVNAAAAECGFENMSYFARTYKKLTGSLPSDDIPEA